jgi:transcriptional regulator with XRE-family HTH domain
MKNIPSALLRAARCGLRLEQKDIAERAEVSTPTMSMIETGAGNPKRSTMTLVRRAFGEMGVTFEEFSGGQLGVIFDPTNEVVGAALAPAKKAPVKKAAPASKKSTTPKKRAKA